MPLYKTSKIRKKTFKNRKKKNRTKKLKGGSSVNTDTYSSQQTLFLLDRGLKEWGKLQGTSLKRYSCKIIGFKEPNNCLDKEYDNRGDKKLVDLVNHLNDNTCYGIKFEEDTTDINSMNYKQNWINILNNINKYNNRNLILISGHHNNLRCRLLKLHGYKCGSGSKTNTGLQNCATIKITFDSNDVKVSFVHRGSVENGNKWNYINDETSKIDMNKQCESIKQPIKAALDNFINNKNLLNKTIYIIRHGEAAHNEKSEKGCKPKVENSPLTKNGIEQCKTAAERINLDYPESINNSNILVITSPLDRTIETALNVVNELTDNRCEDLNLYFNNQRSEKICKNNKLSGECKKNLSNDQCLRQVSQIEKSGRENSQRKKSGTADSQKKISRVETGSDIQDAKQKVEEKLVSISLN